MICWNLTLLSAGKVTWPILANKMVQWFWLEIFSCKTKGYKNLTPTLGNWTQGHFYDSFFDESTFDEVFSTTVYSMTRFFNDKLFRRQFFWRHDSFFDDSFFDDRYFLMTVFSTTANFWTGCYASNDGLANFPKNRLRRKIIRRDLFLSSCQKLALT